VSVAVRGGLSDALPVRGYRAGRRRRRVNLGGTRLRTSRPPSDCGRGAILTPSEWETLYREALREQDTENVAEVCERARRAINDRLIELAAQKTTLEKEREQLFEALRRLLIHEQKVRSPN
jgi:hypothetical protein